MSREFVDVSWLSRYGMYHVKVTVLNNVSSVVLPVSVIQVGDNVTAVDVAVADWLVPVSAPVNLTIDCPRGWPIILTVDMGDGQPPQRITRPDNYDPSTDDRAPRRRTQAAGSRSASTTMTPAAPSRRRRDVDETPTVGQPFVVTYQYRSPGRYKYVHQLSSLSAFSVNNVYYFSLVFTSANSCCWFMEYTCVHSVADLLHK